MQQNGSLADGCIPSTCILFRTPLIIPLSCSAAHIILPQDNININGASSAGWRVHPTWLTAAIPIENPYCSCKLARMADRPDQIGVAAGDDAIVRAILAMRSQEEANKNRRPAE